MIEEMQIQIRQHATDVPGSCGALSKQNVALTAERRSALLREVDALRRPTLLRSSEE
jgi:UDP-N-acetylenolpyruvoylglucosamine reductase